jgi:hypothetical protein
MATYKYSGSEMVFPSLFDKDGNVLVVKDGDTFDGPDGLTNEGLSIVGGKTAKINVEPDTTSVDDSQN